MFQIVATVLCLLVLAQCLLIVVVAEISIHPPVVRRPCDTDCMALHVAKAMGGTASLVQIEAVDGVQLSAWWIQVAGAGEAVLLCHGVADTAFGVMGAALLFLRNGYSVLTPDNRGHGRSGGFVTYGVREADDIAKWQAWIRARGIEKCFGFGESLGASSLLQSVTKGAEFSAVIAECPFSTFTGVAYDRMHYVLSKLLPGEFACGLSNIWVAALVRYVRMRYGVHLAEARPIDSLQSVRCPVLLIHGTDDRETPPHHSERLAAENRQQIKLWLAPGAKHTGAYAAEPEEFEARVLALLNHE